MHCIVFTVTSDKVKGSDTKAASPLVNCGCQCAPLTFRDAKVSVDVYICWS